MTPGAIRYRSQADRLAPAVPRRVVLVALVAGGVAAGFAAGGWGGATPADAELVQLLRMMAVLKLAMVGGAAWLVDWRLRQPVGPGAACAYLAGLGLMAVGPGLIWGLAHVVLGAVLLHGGLALLLVLACKDEDFRLPLPRR